MSAVAAPAEMFPESDYEDGVYYPSSDGKPMAETGIHVLAIFALFEALEEYFRGRPEVLVTANQAWYWKKGDPKARRAPDIMVVPGVGREPLRRSYRMWLENNTLPAAIFEMSSRKTVRSDLQVKLPLYESLGVHEYFLFDPERHVLRPNLQGFRLHNGRYSPIRTIGGALESDLGFRIRVEGLVLRLIDATTGDPVLTASERVDAAKAENADSQVRVDEAMGLVREAREALEEKVAQLTDAEAEIARLRQQLRDLSGGQS